MDGVVWIVWAILWLLAAVPWLTVCKRPKGGSVGGAAAFLRVILTAALFGVLALACLPEGVMWWVWAAWLVLWTTVEAFALSLRTAARLVLGLLLVCVVASGCFFAVLAGYNNALYFDSFIRRGEGFPIKGEIPDGLLRVTTEELARTIAAQHMAEFGGAMKIVDMEVTMYRGRLVWVAVVARQGAWGATYKTEGLIIVDANDPDRKPEILRQGFAVAQGLTFNPLIGAWGSAAAKGYYGIDASVTIGDTYPVFTPDGRWMMAMTSYIVDWRGVRHYNGIYLVDEDGNVVGHYRDEIPDWLVQPFDEDGFLEGGISDWGGHRRDGGFDFFAGGFLWIPPSPDRLRMAEDTRYIYDPDEGRVVALVMVHPVREGGELSLAGAFKVTSKGIYYYDLKEYNLMSGRAASGIVKSKITARAGTEYFTAMELLYPLQAGNRTRYVWFVPIYFENLETHQIGLAGLGLVDAQAADKVVIQYTGEGISGPALIRKAKEAFRALYGQEATPEARLVTGKLTAKYEPYVENGNTRQWITVETQGGEKLDVLLKAEVLSDRDWLKVQKVEVGQEISLEVDANNVVVKVLP